jgi:hypothetical protein
MVIKLCRGAVLAVQLLVPCDPLALATDADLARADQSSDSEPSQRDRDRVPVLPDLTSALASTRSVTCSALHTAWPAAASVVDLPAERLPDVSDRPRIVRPTIDPDPWAAGRKLVRTVSLQLRTAPILPTSTRSSASITAKSPNAAPGRCLPRHPPVSADAPPSPAVKPTRSATNAKGEVPARESNPVLVRPYIYRLRTFTSHHLQGETPEREDQ